MARVRIAFIGAGVMGRHHIAVAERHPEIEIAGVAEFSPDARETLAAKGYATFADHREMLAVLRPEGVVISTPNAFHAPAAIDCLATGAGASAESITLGLTPGLGKLFGAGLMMRVRSDMEGVSLSVVEEMSFVLIDAIERDEIHLALAYEVPDRPGLARVPLLDEALLFVTKASDETGPIAFEEVLEHTLALAGERDHVHQLVLRSAEAIGKTPKVGFEASSVGIMKSLVMEGSVASVMPYGSVIGEMGRGELTARHIEGGSLVRTLYLLHSLRRPPLIHEAELAELIKLQIRSALGRVQPMVTPREGLAPVEAD